MWYLLFLLGVVSVWLWSEPSLWLRLPLFLGLVVWLGLRAQREGLVPQLRELWRKFGKAGEVGVVCFAGALYDLPSWTNRQQVMSRMSRRYPVLYVEPRVWLPRQMWRLRTSPERLVAWLIRLFWYQQMEEGLVAIAQANLIPGSRRWASVSWFNQKMNEWWVLWRSNWLGFGDSKKVVWIYDTEAVAYVSVFAGARIVYDCVDDHAEQAGVDRNPGLVRREEEGILRAADLVVVTSKRLYEMKRAGAKQVELVLNAGDVELYAEDDGEVPEVLRNLKRPILGSVGALDTYKYDFGLLREVAAAHSQWQFVFVGEPVVDRSSKALRELRALPNVEVVGAVPRAQVPSFVQAFDVALIPYKDNEYNRASFPLKFWEFMATGKPLVVSGLPELQEYSDLIEYVGEGDSFAGAVERALQDSRGSERVKLAMEHGWQQRVDRLVELLEEIV